MHFLTKNSNNEHVKEYVAILAKMAVKMYSEPKLYIPRKRRKDGVLGEPDLSKRWYVYYYFRDPTTGKMGNRPFKQYRGLNRAKTVAARKAAGKILVNTTRRILNEGYNPYLVDSAKGMPSKSVKTCFTEALENKKPYLKSSTFDSYRDYLRAFLKWAEQNGIDRMPIDRLNKKHISGYVNYLGRAKPNGKGLMPTSIHNHKSNLSAIMAQMVEDDVVADNFIEKITTKKNKPSKNEPFSLKELNSLKSYTKAQEPLLYDFLQFIFYCFMRNNEIVRIQIKHIDLEQRTIKIETKGEKKSHIYMIESIYQLLLNWKVDRYPKEYFLFTPNGRPGKWNASVKSKVDFFSERFARAKKELRIPKNKNSYSLRHNAAIDLFTSFRGQGLTEKEAIYKLMEITRHKDEAALRKYLREVGGILPKDWGGHYNITF